MKNIKHFLTLFAIVSMLAACSSNSKQDEEEAARLAQEQAAAEQAAADEAARQAEEDAARQAEEDRLANVETVFYFDFDQSILTAASRAALTVHAEILQNDPRAIRVEGHADERGSREYNMALGERRANSVRDFLVLQGVDSSLIETVSYGEERPAEVGSYDSAWSKNRRAELK